MVLFDSLIFLFWEGSESRMYRALYRKWRPTTFDDVVGQEHITSILKYQCEQGKHSHAYLFCGTRGTGKTTCSKILAKALNCLSPVNGNPCGKCVSCVSIDNGSCMDVIEMDAASNNGIDDIRDIRDEVVYTPSELKYKVYIIDEVHMLSINAFNGLLKTLEEPPSYVVFILATTEMHKLPTTIVSRCQRFDFKKISIDNIMSRLRHIAVSEGVTISDDASRIIARLASGGMRDAISLFELCSGTGRPIDAELARDMLGVSGSEKLAELVSAVKKKDYAAIFRMIRDAESSSKDISVLWQELISFYRDMLVVKTLKDPAEYLEMSDSEYAAMRELTSDMTSAEIIRQSGILDSTLSVMQKAGSYKRNIAEMTLVRLCDPTLDNSSDAMLSRLNELESRVMRLNAVISDISLGNINVSVSHPAEVQQEKATSDRSASIASDEHKQVEIDFPSSGIAVEAEPEFVPEEKAGQRTELPYWDDVIESVKKNISTAKGFIDFSEAYKTADGDYTIVVESDMAAKMLSREKTRVAIADAISFYEQTRVSDAQLNFVSDASQKKKRSPIDDLI